jgi:thioester reductase-like protein
MKIDAIVRRLSDDAKLARDPVAQMIEDSALPRDVVPPECPAAAADLRNVLLTGATGFLGAWLLRSLMEETTARIHCLARGAHTGLQRIRENLESYGIWDNAFEGRVSVIAGDLDQPSAGMSPSDYASLSRSIHAIYHCGAAVNWIHPYRRLAGINVGGTRELLRFACATRPKAFHFVSSSAVCYSTSGPRSVDEHIDMLPHIDGMHLGYAQTKCVAESLVRQAGERGLPVAIYRPALLSGDSVSGCSNPDDFLSRFIKGCIEMGSAPELDWTMDCFPVNAAAQSIVRLSRRCDSTGGAAPVFHLTNPNGRTWRECILWINLFGYPVRLIPYRAWISELRETARRPGHPLRELAAFFCRPLPGESSAYMPRLYEDCQNIHVRASESAVAREDAGVSCPALDASLFDRYFQSFIGTGFLAPAPQAPVRPRGAATDALDSCRLGAILGRNVSRAIRLSERSADSIVTELTSWRFKTTAGLFPYRLELENGASLDVMVKIKPRDTEVLDVAESIARLASEALGQAFAEFRDHTEFVRCDVREPAVYAESDPRFRRHMPELHGVSGRTLALEYLQDVVLKDSASDVSGWTAPAVAAAIAGLAEIHAVWLGRREALMQSPLGSTLVDPDVTRMTPFWIALAEHARPWFAEWAGAGVVAIQDEAIARLSESWRTTKQLPSTLIHNDFNPRNLALRKSADTLRLCAYDWELAKPGLAQHDLAEFLCFVLPETIGRNEVSMLVEMHRDTLEHASGRSLNREDWILGFALSLSDLLVNRFAMYAMAHRFRKQPFLPRILRVWRRLHAMFPAR